jgi:hypothetical protein
MDFVQVKEKPSDDDAVFATKSSIRLRESLQGTFYLHAHAYGVPLPLLLDSGCSFSIISREFYNSISGNRKPKVSTYGRRISCTDDSFLTTYAKAEFTFSVKRREYTI